MYTHTHTQWNITQPLKEWNNVICSNMDGPRDYHTKWNKADKDKYIKPLPCGILKSTDTNEFVYKT